MSKKSSTFASAFSKKVEISRDLGSPKILIFGESESMAKIHMSDVVANRIEP